MKDKIKGKNPKVFLHSLLSYIVILSIPLIINIFAYGKVMRLAEHDARNSAISLLIQSRDILDNKFMEITNIAHQIALNPKINKVLDNDIAMKNTFYYYWDVSRELSYYRAINSFADDFFIYLKNDNVIIAHDYVTKHLPFFYQVNLKYDGMDYKSWYNSIWDKYHYDNFIPAQSMYIDGKYEQVITYIQSLPVDLGYSSHGVVFFLINERKVQELFSNSIQNGGWACIINDKGELIASIGEEKDIVNLLSSGIVKFDDSQGSIINRRDGTVISYAVSNYKEWTYVSAYPFKVVMAKVQYIKSFVIVLTILALLAGLALSSMLSTKNSKNIKKLLDIFKGYSNYGKDNKSIYDFLQDSITGLVKDNKKLENAMNEKTAFIKSVIIDKLLSGGYNNMAEVDAALCSVNMQLHYDYYLVTVAKINESYYINNTENISKLNMDRIIVSRILNDIVKGRGLVHQLDEDTIAILFYFNETDKIIIENEVNEITDITFRVLKNNGVSISFGGGTVYNSLLKVFHSYNEAKDALEYMLFRQSSSDISSIHWYRNTPRENIFYYYPIEIENRISNLAKAGDIENIQRIFNELYKENFIRRRLSKGAWDFLFNELKGTLMRMIMQPQFRNNERFYDIIASIQSITGHSEADDIWEEIINICKQLCEVINSEKRNCTTQLKERILEYIDMEYMDPQMSLYMVASKFELSEGYVSRFLKEQTGLSFTEHLENVRMKKANKLLVETDLSINDIAESVGYTSAHAFRRAFKRIYGVVPSTMREIKV